MKRLLALLLVLCLTVGLVACVQPGQTENPSAQTTNPPASNPPASNPPETTQSVENEKPFAGKTLQVWGFTAGDAFKSPDDIDAGIYLWMMRAAMDEWAALNEVTIVYEKDYAQDVALSAMNAGECPDLAFHGAEFPSTINMGVFKALTDDEYAQLAAVCGERYLDLYTLKGKSYGVNFPWTGTNLIYFNKTMFESYGAKTPLEYFMEDNWTWETFQQACADVTKDIDSDGTVDTIGFPVVNFRNFLNSVDEAEDGTLSTIFDTEIARDFLEMMYTSVTEKGIILPGSSNVYRMDTPRVAMSVGDAEPYNYQHVFSNVENGDELVCVPIPRHSNDDPNYYQMYTVSGMGIFKTCDEVEATMSLMSYILEVGMKYVSDMSLGVVPCDYEGMLGVTEYSKAWKEKFAVVCAERAAGTADLANYDEDYMVYLNEYLDSSIPNIGRFYNGVSSWQMGQMDGAGYKLPPASAIAALEPAHQAEVDRYNSLYVY